MDTIPPMNLSPEATQWGRWAQNQITELHRNLQRSIDGQANNAAMSKSSTRVTTQNVQSLTQFTTNLQSQINALVGANLSTGNVMASGTVTAGGTISTPGTLQGDTGVTSVGAYNLDVSTLSGTRRTMWIHQSGAMGYAPSTREKKANIRDYPGSAAAFLACGAKVFEYIAQISIRDDPGNPQYDPSYIVPTDTGMLAEDLIDAGLGEFVFYEPDGTIAGIDYITFTAVGFSVVARDHEARLLKLEGAAR